MTDDRLRAALDEFFDAYDRTHLVHDVAYENVNDAVAALRLARRAALAASATDEGPTALPWLIRFTCCGRADGVAARATWEEADALRQSYVAGGGHERSAVIEDALAARPALPALDEDRGPRLIKLPPVDDDNRCTGCGALVKRDGSCKCKVATDDR